MSDLIVRDVQQVANIGRVSELRQLLALLAVQVGGILTAEPKLVFVDSGLATHLAGTLASTQSNAIGGLLESFVLWRLRPAEQ